MNRSEMIALAAASASHASRQGFSNTAKALLEIAEYLDQVNDRETSGPQRPGDLLPASRAKAPIALKS